MVTERKPAPRRGLRNLFRRWRAARHPLSDSLWTRALATSAYARALPKSERAQLRELTTQLLRAKSFEGAAGFGVGDAVRARIALHAAIPILRLGPDYYADWVSVVIYPGDFRVHDEYMDEHGIVHREITDLCGQSLSRGPMVLSWEAMRAEDETPGDYDLVIHECAHKLDLLNGDANGFPPLPADMDARAWTRDFEAAWRRLCAGLDDGTDSGRIDPYAAEDPAEFFAVLSETFFTAPQRVRAEYPAVYGHLRDFYRQDPLKYVGNAR